MPLLVCTCGFKNVLLAASEKWKHIKKGIETLSGHVKKPDLSLFVMIRRHFLLSFLHPSFFLCLSVCNYDFNYQARQEWKSNSKKTECERVTEQFVSLKNRDQNIQSEFKVTAGRINRVTQYNDYCGCKLIIFVNMFKTMKRLWLRFQ